MTNFTNSEVELAQWLSKRLSSRLPYKMIEKTHQKNPWLLTARELQKKMVGREYLIGYLEGEIAKAIKIGESENHEEINWVEYNERVYFLRMLKSHFLKGEDK